ncbi:hypothetical protein B005_4441 [Nocardiopsis alba ATCC BAA-2165]|uniref:Uncharacterized protein n=1 Tax=Nocardiopsis alba (strain ATCC BAA-2165 / BE74) TaxID=1205910 RepID=J7L8E7_NOCAA|nr:hypothetical protein B005_4441 [Nocardiopsis alba ATCC BAA-2165]
MGMGRVEERARGVVLGSFLPPATTLNGGVLRGAGPPRTTSVARG